MFVMILATQFVPAVVIVLPFFLLFRDLGLLDTRIGLILVNLSIVTPFALWMIKGFIDGIPRDTEEAGPGGRLPRGSRSSATSCSPMAGSRHRHRRHLLLHHRLERLPVRAHPSPPTRRWTLTVGLALSRRRRADLWNLLAAAGIIIMVPMFVLALVIQKHFVQGMTMGAVR